MEEGEREAKQEEIRCLLPGALHTGVWEKWLSNPHAVPSNWGPLGCPRRGQGATKRVSFLLTASRVRLVFPGWALPASAHPVEREPVWLGLPVLPPIPELCGLC